MKNLLQTIRENKKMLIAVIVTILLFTVYANAQVNEFNKKIEEEKYQKQLVQALYEERQKNIDDKEKIDEMISNLEKSKLKKDEEIYKLEHIIRCEKENNWKEEKDDCKTNWRNYPKKVNSKEF